MSDPVKLEPGTAIQICHIVDGGVWGYGEDCSSRFHNHDRVAYVTRHYPGRQVCYVNNDPATWDKEHLGSQREFAVPDIPIDDHRKAWRKAPQ